MNRAVLQRCASRGAGAGRCLLSRGCLESFHRVGIATLGMERFSPEPKVKLLVLQPSPFCNIDCAYCYLPDRDSRASMPLPVVEATIRNLMGSDLVGEQLSIAWHAGEPLAVGPEFYRRAFDCIETVVAGRFPVRHSIQTN